MSRILILAQFAEAYLARLRQRFDVIYEPWLETGALADPVELGERLAAGGIDFLVIEADFIFSETFEAAPNLRFVGVCRGDVGPHVDLDAAAKHGATVVTTPGRNAVAVAELTVGLLLSLARRIPQAHDLIRRGAWDSPLDGYGRWGGVELAGRTAGLIGLGAIGRQVARRLLALEMRVLAYDPYVREGTGLAVELTDKTTLLVESDFVSIHCPLTAETRGLLDALALARMKPGAYLVNTARAAIINEAALVAALREHRIAGAALDVFPVEPLPTSSALLGLDNVILTPHIGGATAGVVTHHSQMITEAIESYARGEQPQNALT